MVKRKLVTVIAVIVVVVVTLFSNEIGYDVSQAGAVASQQNCNQQVEMEYGTTSIAYPVAIVDPNRGECGSGIKDWLFPDKVLVYNTPGGGRAYPDNIKMWSNSARVRGAMQVSYSGRVSANGLCSTTTRVCVGAAGRLLSGDLHSLYIWHRSPIAR